MKHSYRVTLRTQFGPQTGILTLIEKNATLKGSIQCMGNTNYFKNGKMDGNTFQFSGILNIGFYNIRYQINGEVHDPELTATAATSYGNFPITGTQIS